MDFRQAAATWLVAQCEPLVPTLDRAVAEEAFVAVLAESPERVAWWFAGVISDHVRSLPPADPWRHLSARAGSTITRGMLPKPPASTGAVGPNGTFGSLQDCVDLVQPSFADASTDIGLAAVAAGIGPAAAALLAFGADGPQSCARAVLAVHSELLAERSAPREAAGMTFAACTDAIRWSVWRRRAYVGLGDDWTLASGFAWLWRADELAANGDLPTGEWSEAEQALTGAAIDPETYGLITGA